MAPSPQLPLSGVRVLDFTRVLAGPLCTMLLADLGAEVIKVENPNGGDETRAWGPPWVGDTEDRLSAYFVSINRNKRSLALNLKSDEGRRIARELAAKSHILIENFKPGQMQGFGLDYDSLKVLNPTLVYCSITGFGQSGLYHDRPGYDFVIQAMTGLMAITGPADGEPHKVGVAVSDVFTALYTANAVQAALRHAERTEQGQAIDMALFDSQLAALVNIASNFLVSGQNPSRYGNQHANIVPYQTFQASDGAFVVAVGNDRQFAQLCTVLNQPELANDPRFSTNPQRVANRDVLIPLLQRTFSTKTVAEWVKLLLDVGIPAGPINSVEAALNDPHTQSRGMVQEMPLDDDVLRMIASPMQLQGTPPQLTMLPPKLGQHTQAILTDVLGLSSDEIATLYQNGSIA